MGTESVTDAAARHARFGTLPPRVRFDEMVEEKEATPSGVAIESFNPESSWSHFSCLAVDLGL